MKNLMGTGVALVTPFGQDNSVDVGALERVAEYCISGGVDYLVVLGTTAESVTLTKTEKQQVMETVIATNKGRLPLVLGVGGNNTAAIIEELKSLDLSEFEAILSVSPYYNKPTQEGIYQHFMTIAEVAPKPIILYNVPSRTGSNVLPETTLRLANDSKNIVAIKEASGDINQIAEIINSAPGDFLIISGDDFTALPTVMAGGAGVISVLGQGLPEAFSKMISLGLKNEEDQAQKIHDELLPLMQLIFEEGNPAGIKSIFENIGLASAKVRLPLVEASPKLKNKIGTFLESLEKAHA
ncbi:4-hydroxy-tetrahydrodipicolinate synthase [Flagellimonas nanhaiensis]|uniref:4-hydroxy-tetrahydrodipicolinate synthase n=1 Tax=Flagellimonas nanhaiensis TaxID=2292706 RepID=A0A371JU65_9FLAO|nr:4-hydroxy-tetrahydrodipicolinate synthase [Allomuricauda nanhaiensis]RDY61319.1 4-hydroxy-tetrahydrodipicolinate synthase [Allomuricauda nanhaiensis]